MNTRIARIGLTVVIAAQCVWLLGMAITHERGLIEGEAILLEARPVDPRDLLRGDYVILSYKISDLPLSKFGANAANVAPGQTVYVELEPRGEFYDAIAASLTPPKPASGRVVLKGTAVKSWNADSVHVVYGLERYYVREGTGTVRGKLSTKVMVSRSGKGSLKELYVDGVPFPDAAKQTKMSN